MRVRSQARDDLRISRNSHGSLPNVDSACANPAGGSGYVSKDHAGHQVIYGKSMNGGGSRRTAASSYGIRNTGAQCGD